jgi:hypothetical protein
MIWRTAGEGTYDEALIRKAVSFDLAELIIKARKLQEDMGLHPTPASTANKGEGE